MRMFTVNSHSGIREADDINRLVKPDGFTITTQQKVGTAGEIEPIFMMESYL